MLTLRPMPKLWPRDQAKPHFLSQCWLQVKAEVEVDAKATVTRPRLLPRSKFWLANISQICGLEVEARTQGWGQGQYYGTWVEVNIFTWRTRPKFCPWGQWSLNFGLGQKAGKLRSWLRLVLQSQSWGLDFNLKAMPRQMASRLNSLA